MGRGIEDLKETAACGMLIHYTVDLGTDFVLYNDINARGENRKCGKCKGCSWSGICKPTAPNYIKIINDAVGYDVNPVDVITQVAKAI